MKDVINRYLDQEILQQLYKGLEKVQYSRVACAIRIKTLQCLREQLPLQEPPDFYGRVLKSFDELANYFEDVCREQSHLPVLPCEEVVAFRRILLTYALTTEDLQLRYFREVSQIHSPVRRSQVFCRGSLVECFIPFSMTTQLRTVKSFFVQPMNLSMD